MYPVKRVAALLVINYLRFTQVHIDIMILSQLLVPVHNHVLAQCLHICDEVDRHDGPGLLDIVLDESVRITVYLDECLKYWSKKIRGGIKGLNNCMSPPTMDHMPTSIGSLKINQLRRKY